MTKIISTSVMIILVMLLRKIFRKQVSQCMIYGLWLLVAVNLLIPFRVENSYSIMNFFPVDISEVNNVQNFKKGQNNKVDLNQNITESNLFEQNKQNEKDKQRNKDLSGTVSENLNDNITKITNESGASDGKKAAKSAKKIHSDNANESAMEHKKTRISAMTIINIVVKSVSICIGLWLVIVNITFKRKLKNNRVSLRKYKGLQVYETFEVETPCLFGIIHPSIYIPIGLTDGQTDANFEMILLHEWVHFKHKDNIWTLVRGVCVCLYWYNPLVWVASVFSAKDGEIACDEGVVSRIGEKNRKAYGKMLIELCEIVSNKKNQYILVQEFGRGNQEMKNRITFIGRKQRRKLSGVLAMLVLAAVVTGCTTGTKSQSKVENSAETSGTDSNKNVVDSEKQYTYNSKENEYITESTENKETPSEVFVKSTENKKESLLDSDDVRVEDDSLDEPDYNPEKIDMDYEFYSGDESDMNHDMDYYKRIQKNCYKDSSSIFMETYLKMLMTKDAAGIDILSGKTFEKSHQDELNKKKNDWMTQVTAEYADVGQFGDFWMKLTFSNGNVRYVHVYKKIDKNNNKEVFIAGDMNTKFTY